MNMLTCFKILIPIAKSSLFRSTPKKHTLKASTLTPKVSQFLENSLKTKFFLDGMIYFVEGNSVGSEFGFPRVEIKKRYRW